MNDFEVEIHLEEESVKTNNIKKFSGKIFSEKSPDFEAGLNEEAELPYEVSEGRIIYIFIVIALVFGSIASVLTDDYSQRIPSSVMIKKIPETKSIQTSNPLNRRHFVIMDKNQTLHDFRVLNPLDIAKSWTMKLSFAKEIMDFSQSQEVLLFSSQNEIFVIYENGKTPMTRIVTDSYHRTIPKGKIPPGLVHGHKFGFVIGQFYWLLGSDFSFISRFL